MLKQIDVNLEIPPTPFPRASRYLKEADSLPRWGGGSLAGDSEGSAGAFSAAFRAPPLTQGAVPPKIVRTDFCFSSLVMTRQVFSRNFRLECADEFSNFLRALLEPSASSYPRRVGTESSAPSRHRVWHPHLHLHAHLQRRSSSLSYASRPPVFHRRGGAGARRQTLIDAGVRHGSPGLSRDATEIPWPSRRGWGGATAIF